MSYQEDQLKEELDLLTARVAELEARLARLEAGPAPRPVVSGGGEATGPALGSDELTAALVQALEQLGEADAGALRQQMIKNGLPASLGRSEVNKALYASKNRFVIDRQEGAKPIWKLA